MAYYNSLNSLGENILKHGDTVDFIGIKYTVTKNYLHNQNGKLNDQIFDKLDIKGKYTFCSSRYGYIVTTGIWPEYRDHDFPAATRLVKALFKIIEDKEAVTSEKSEKSKEVAIDKPLKEESKLSVLLPSKHRSIKQVEAQKEITLNKL